MITNEQLQRIQNEKGEKEVTVIFFVLSGAKVSISRKQFGKSEHYNKKMAKVSISRKK